eukprot:CAMPEP_0179111422 /NCGR_PEP_ID=MMETSP0796-20121207/52041_1 /TAXON_ID=73915 /ORGANISM="Pyrodinium bahamense, Strain pbaha01" /LENGTH=531 /DNA_ID=CAMNT_0020809571 /DNA_START=57 /DNA_END=1652 /DNA_ORIENTATION=-
MPKEFVEDVKVRLAQLQEGHCGASIVFPATLCAAERHRIHEIAKSMSMASRSSGEGKERRIEVFRDGAPPAALAPEPAAEASREERVSKALSSVLRHRAEGLGLGIRRDGFVRLHAVVALATFQKMACGAEEIQALVRNCAKQRFSLVEEEGEMWIRANQGHTISTVTDTALLTPIREPAELCTCVHGTYFTHWPKILEEGLRCMGRNHIHFVTQKPGQAVISGMRSDVQVAIYVDAPRALADGCEFFASANGVVLSRGFGGALPPKYFLQAVLVAECSGGAADAVLYSRDQAVEGGPARGGGGTARPGRALRTGPLASASLKEDCPSSASPGPPASHWHVLQRPREQEPGASLPEAEGGPVRRGVARLGGATGAAVPPRERAGEGGAAQGGVAHPGHVHSGAPSSSSSPCPAAGGWRGVLARPHQQETERVLPEVPAVGCHLDSSRPSQQTLPASSSALPGTPAGRLHGHEERPREQEPKGPPPPEAPEGASAVAGRAAGATEPSSGGGATSGSEDELVLFKRQVVLCDR